MSAILSPQADRVSKGQVRDILAYQTER
jgi:hypothetical protein